MKNVLDHTLAHQRYFEEMTRIPHGSFQEGAYAKYLVAFAKEHQLAYKHDEMNNVIIYKDASKGYEDHPALILQAHTDMVCEKNKDTEFDFYKDALQLVIEDGFLKAKGTTLGADDGTGVAYMLAILEDKEAKHPALECIFTVQEEVGLFGAMAIKKEDIHAKRMINLDDGGESATCTTSAGGVNVILKKERILVPVSTQGYSLEVKGLFGGHSGGEIDKERGNANKLLARILYKIDSTCGLQIHSINGGIKDNAIPREAVAIFVSDASYETMEKLVRTFEKEIKKELEFSDKGVHVVFQKEEVCEAMATVESEALVKLLCALPNGMRARSMDIKDLVTASSNVGVIESGEHIIINCSVRGALESFVDMIGDEVEILGEAFEYESEREARYPAWSYTKESPMRETLQKVCRELYEKELELVAVHGGLECGVFKALDEDMDIVTMGPIMFDIHTPDEKLDLASFDRTFTFLKTYLEQL
ncbi:MAG: beta-Ala-His dipeptidase [Longicatena sp.]